MKRYRNTVLLNMRLNRIILLIFALLTICSVFLVRIRLLENAQQLGNYVTWNYAAQEQNNITIYQTLVEIGTQYIDEKTIEGLSTEEIQDWVYNLLDNISDMLHNTSVNLYAIVDGEIIAAKPWNDMEQYDYKTTEWYQAAIAAKGEVIFTDVYEDVATGKLVITIAQKAKYTDSVLMFDVFLDNFHAYNNPERLPQNSSYFLCDSTGTPLYYLTDLNLSYEQVTDYTKQILQSIQSGQLEGQNVDWIDPNGEKQGVYYYEMQNGWISILTMPVNSILSGLQHFSIGFAGVLFLFLCVFGYMAIRDHHIHRKISHVTDTVQVLGDSYYAIYRVNYRNSTYEMIKAAPDVEALIAPVGRYRDLLETIKIFVDYSVFQQFEKSFSIQNIQKIVEGKVNDYGGDYLRRFGECQKWVNVRLLQDSNLMPDEVVLCFREVDAEKKQQIKHIQLLESALESARENEHAKITFFNSMSHDMRTPLNVILNLAGLIKANVNQPEKVEEYVQKISYSGTQLLTLINDLLEISRLERTDLDLTYEKLNLKECVQACVQSFMDMATVEGKQLDVQFQIQNQTILGDATRITQILNNLLSNAFKYSEAGAEILVKVKQFQQGKNTRYQLIVTDTGIGMSKEFLGNIFESYSRETRFGSKNVMGTGLGMPIVQRLVHQMGGEITVESELGEGSTFTVTLPFQIVEDAQEEQTEQDSTMEQKELVSLAGKRILLAEDNEINMEIASEILKMQDIDVIEVFDGKQAFEAFASSEIGSVDAILMDMLMPNMDGCAAAKAIRALERPDAKTVPIIAVTANAFAEDIAKTTEAGMNAHISKPIDFEVLCNTLQELLNP